MVSIMVTLAKLSVGLNDDCAETERREYSKMEPTNITPQKITVEPENDGLEDQFPCGMTYFQGLC